jgi:ribonuclease HI
MNQVIILADGGSRGNPGPAASGWVVLEFASNLSQAEILAIISSGNITEFVKHKGGTFLGNTTNNVAEWQAVVEGVEWVKNNYESNVVVSIFLDSELVVKQIKGIYKVKHPNLKGFHTKISVLLMQVNYQINHIPRKLNYFADGIVNQILDQQLGK